MRTCPDFNTLLPPHIKDYVPQYARCADPDGYRDGDGQALAAFKTVFETETING